MKSKILLFLGIGAIAFAVACNSANDETANKDTSAATTVDNTAGVSADASVQTAGNGNKYILRKRSTSAATSGSEGSTASTGSDYDTVWLYMGTEDRYYTLSGSAGRDTLYYNTDQWNSWWSSTETDKELKSKSGNTKIKVEADGSWKVKDDTSKTKMNDKGKVKTKPKG